jgi:voltage-gated potassium channel
MPEQEQSRHSVEATAYDVFISVAAIASIAIVSWLFVADPNTEEAKLLNHFDDFFCLVFFIDYLRQIFKAKKKVRYIFGWGLFDLASSIPAIGPLRFLRLIRILRVLRAVRSIRILTQVFKSDLVGATIVSSMTMSMGGIILACFGVLHYESTAIGANIKTADDVVWWAVVTTSTVGYGDFYPVTGAGRLLAALVMVLGIGLFATIAGAIASRLTSISPVSHTKSLQKRMHDLQEQNHELLKKLESHLKS